MKPTVTVRCISCRRAVREVVLVLRQRGRAQHRCPAIAGRLVIGPSGGPTIPPACSPVRGRDGRHGRHCRAQTSCNADHAVSAPDPPVPTQAGAQIFGPPGDYVIVVSSSCAAGAPISSRFARCAGRGSLRAWYGRDEPAGCLFGTRGREPDGPTAEWSARDGSPHRPGAATRVEPHIHSGGWSQSPCRVCVCVQGVASVRASPITDMVVVIEGPCAGRRPDEWSHR
ncbi:hypothetical protein MLGJGCBP_07888 [Rhodococcus sp. T7]|nr:hypothetical protein MLGJGCBP_09003 [Rhodococcus sp. T7]KAF0959011.1 hypothetical protein MLGJGCBP_07888 [Rhodococcus sp. T7]